MRLLQITTLRRLFIKSLLTIALQADVKNWPEMREFQSYALEAPPWEP